MRANLLNPFRTRLTPSVCSGNITHHCDTAYDSLRSVDGDYPDFDRKMSKARLLLMTTEPTALDMFKADPFCARHFDIEPLPQGGTGRPFLQMEFWQLSREDRVEDAVRMLVQAELLANYADTTVVSSNSNTGRSLIFLRGGPARAIEQHRIRSVDIYWHVRLDHVPPALSSPPLHA